MTIGLSACQRAKDTTHGALGFATARVGIRPGHSFSTMAVLRTPVG